MVPKKRKRIAISSKNKFPGYPAYPKSEDIYEQEKEEKDLDPEDISKKKSTPNPHSLGDDLDIPGAELDDDQEETGNEDEENNYYSLGGDDHNDLEEDKS
jgi:hypothetical protein